MKNICEDSFDQKKDSEEKNSNLFKKKKRLGLKAFLLVGVILGLAIFSMGNTRGMPSSEPSEPLEETLVGEPVKPYTEETDVETTQEETRSVRKSSPPDGTSRETDTAISLYPSVDEEKVQPSEIPFSEVALSRSGYFSDYFQREIIDKKDSFFRQIDIIDAMKETTSSFDMEYMEWMKSNGDYIFAFSDMTEIANKKAGKAILYILDTGYKVLAEIDLTKSFSAYFSTSDWGEVKAVDLNPLGEVIFLIESTSSKKQNLWQLVKLDTTNLDNRKISSPNTSYSPNFETIAEGKNMQSGSEMKLLMDGASNYIIYNDTEVYIVSEGYSKNLVPISLEIEGFQPEEAQVELYLLQDDVLGKITGKSKLFDPYTYFVRLDIKTGQLEILDNLHMFVGLWELKGDLQFLNNNVYQIRYNGIYVFNPEIQQMEPFVTSLEWEEFALGQQIKLYDVREEVIILQTQAQDIYDPLDIPLDTKDTEMPETKESREKLTENSEDILASTDTTKFAEPTETNKIVIPTETIDNIPTTESDKEIIASSKSFSGGSLNSLSFVSNRKTNPKQESEWTFETTSVGETEETTDTTSPSSKVIESSVEQEALASEDLPEKPELITIEVRPAKSLLALERVNKNPHAGKKIIHGVSISEEVEPAVWDMVQKFNQEDEENRIVLYSYYEDYYNTYWFQWHVNYYDVVPQNDLLTLEFNAGYHNSLAHNLVNYSMIDFVVGESRELDVLAKEEWLQDLNKTLKTEIKQDVFDSQQWFLNVLQGDNSQSWNYLTSSFSIEGLVGDKTVFGSEDFQLDAFLQIDQKLSSNQSVFENMTSIELLSKLVENNLTYFYDEVEQRYHFDSPEFFRLIEIAEKYGKKNDYQISPYMVEDDYLEDPWGDVKQDRIVPKIEGNNQTQVVTVEDVEFLEQVVELLELDGIEDLFALHDLEDKYDLEEVLKVQAQINQGDVGSLEGDNSDTDSENNLEENQTQKGALVPQSLMEFILNQFSPTKTEKPAFFPWPWVEDQANYQLLGKSCFALTNYAENEDTVKDFILSSLQPDFQNYNIQHNTELRSLPVSREALDYLLDTLALHSLPLDTTAPDRGKSLSGNNPLDKAAASFKIEIIKVIESGVYASDMDYFILDPVLGICYSYLIGDLKMEEMFSMLDELSQNLHLLNTLPPFSEADLSLPSLEGDRSPFEEDVPAERDKNPSVDGFTTEPQPSIPETGGEDFFGNKEPSQSRPGYQQVSSKHLIVSI